ncbi:hypothetical protein D3C72_2222120 [compost metagenome]
MGAHEFQPFGAFGGLQELEDGFGDFPGVNGRVGGDAAGDAAEAGDFGGDGGG